MKKDLSRRDFLKGSVAGVVSLASMSLLNACAGNDSSAAATQATTEATQAATEAATQAATEAATQAVEVAQDPEAPAFPFEWHELDPAVIEDRVYKGFYTLGGCARTVFDGILGSMAEQYGYPYNQIPTQMYHAGHAGYNVGTLCGSMAGAYGIIGLFVPTEDQDAMVKDLAAWYSAAAFPFYQPEEQMITTVANSVNCSESVTKWMAAADIDDRSHPLRLSRCAGVSADVARKTVEMLNIYFGFATAAPAEDDTPETGENQYLGTATGFGGDVTVRVTMADGKIAQVEVLKHGETAGIGTNAIEGLPTQFNGLATAEEIDALDAVSGATVTSGALKEAVKAALAQVK